MNTYIYIIYHKSTGDNVTWTSNHLSQRVAHLGRLVWIAHGSEPSSGHHSAPRRRSGFMSFPHDPFGRYRMTGWGPSSLAKLVNITRITIVYGTYDYI